MKKILLPLIMIIIILFFTAEAAEIRLVMEEELVIAEQATSIRTLLGYIYDEEGKPVTSLHGETLVDMRTGLQYEVIQNYFVIRNAIIGQSGPYEIGIKESERVKYAHGRYFLDVNGNDIQDADEMTIRTPSFTVVPQVKLNESFEFVVGGGFQYLSGSTEKGMAKNILSLRYTGIKMDLTQTTIDNEGNFVLLLSSNHLFQVGEMELVLKLRDTGQEIVLQRGKATGVPLIFAAENHNFPAGMTNSNIKITVSDLPGDYLISPDTLKSKYKLRTEVYRKENIVYFDNIYINNGESRNLSYEPLSYQGLSRLKAGQYRIIVDLMEYKDGQWQTIRQAEEPLIVTAPAQDYLVENVFRNRDPGTMTVDLGGRDSRQTTDDVVYFSGGKAINDSSLGGYVLKYKVPGGNWEQKHTLVTSRTSTVYPGTLPTGVAAEGYLGDDVSRFSISLVKSGTAEYELEVYSLKEKRYQLLKSYSGTFQVRGYNVLVKNTRFYVGERAFQEIQITDYRGQQINNAYIYIGRDIYGVNNPEQRKASTPGLDKKGIYNKNFAYLFLDPTRISVNDGKYVQRDYSLPSIGKYNIVVYRLVGNQATVMAIVENAIEVIGRSFYRVEADKKHVRAGSEEDYYIRVYDNNMSILPHSIEVLEDGNVYRVLNAVEINALNTERGIRINYAPTGSLKKGLLFRVRNQEGTMTGEMFLPASKASIVFNQPTPGLTEGFSQELRFELRDIDMADPQNMQIRLLDGGAGAKLHLYDVIKDRNFTGSIERRQEYVVRFTAYNLNAQEIEKTNAKPYVRLSIGDILLYDLPVRMPVFDLEPKTFGPGAAELTGKYLDGDRLPLTGKEVFLNGKSIGTTDDSGQIKVSLPPSGKTFNLEGETDITGFRHLLVLNRVGTSVKTEVNLPSTVVHPFAEVKINHPYPMLYISINDVKQKFFLPVKAYTAHVYGLKPGWNDVKVEIHDFHQVTHTEIKQVFYREEIQPISMTIGVVTNYGTPEMISGITMVPVRFAAELGAKMDWDNKSKKVIYSYLNNTIELQSGNSYGYVNGVRRKLAMAPYMNEQGRLMVPLRMIAEELGYEVEFRDRFSPIKIFNK